MKQLRPRAALALAYLLCATATIAAAQISTVPDGARVRFTTRSTDAKFVGELGAQTRDSVRIDDVRGRGGAQGSLVVAVADLRTFERSISSQRHGFLGAVIGGGVAAAAVYVAGSSRRERECSLPSDCADVVIDAGLGALAGVGAVVGGVALGALIGHNIVRDTWEAVAMTRAAPAASRLRLQLTRSRLGLTVMF